jgi:hypothetical protein
MNVSRLILFCLLALSIGPVLAVDVPAMRDYPNHLAVASVLSRSGTDAANPFYQVTWTFNTNLAMEIVVPPLARLIGLGAAGKAFLLFSQLIVIGGAMAIERVVKGRLELSPLAAPLFLYSPPFAWGFLNFEFGFGVALCAIAMWLAMEDRAPVARACVHSVLVVILFVAHLLALGIYGATVGLHELWRLRSGRVRARETLFDMSVLAAPVAIVLGAMLTAGHAVAGAAIETEWRFDLKPQWIFEAMNGYSLLLSCAGMALIFFAVFVLGRRGYLKLSGSGPWIAAGFVVLYVAVPNRFMDTAFNDVRVITAVALILPGFLQLSLPNPTWRRNVFRTAAGLVFVNLALVWWVWLSYRPAYAEITASFDKLAKDSTVLVADSYPPGKPGGGLADYPFYHAPTLAVAYTDALVASLFTYPGDRPVRLRPAYREFAQPGLLAPKIALLPDIASGVREDAPEYLQSWPKKYDYIYVVGPRAPNPMPLVLHELSVGSRFVLYQVDKAAKVP